MSGRRDRRQARAAFGSACLLLIGREAAGSGHGGTFVLQHPHPLQEAKMFEAQEHGIMAGKDRMV